MNACSKSEYQDQFVGKSTIYIKVEDDDCQCWRFDPKKSFQRCPCSNKKYFNDDMALNYSLQSIAENYRAHLDRQKQMAMYFKVNHVTSAPSHVICLSPKLKNPLINRCEEKCKQPARNKEHPVCKQLENRQEKPDCFQSSLVEDIKPEGECCNSCCCCCTCCPCCCYEETPCQSCSKCPNVFTDNSQRAEFLELQRGQNCEPQGYCAKQKRRTCACHQGRKRFSVLDQQTRPFKGCSEIPLDHSFKHFLTAPDIFKLRYMQNEYMTFDDWYTVP